jgi:dCMP deaminase
MENNINRISWNEYFSEFAKLTAKRSPCNRLNVGCILVKDNRVIATGYNGFLPNAPHESIIRDNHEQATVHAEQNCIADCAKRGVNTLNSSAYITHYPCINCYKILVASGIKEIYYINDYKNDNLITIINENLNIKLIKIN